MVVKCPYDLCVNKSVTDKINERNVETLTINYKKGVVMSISKKKKSEKFGKLFRNIV